MRAALPAFDANPDVRALRRALADRIEADLAVLDMLGGDADEEPSLGASEPFCAGPAHDWTYGTGDDREMEDEHGGDVQDEPHDAEEDDDRDSGCGDAEGALEQYGELTRHWGAFA